MPYASTPLRIDMGVQASPELGQEIVHLAVLVAKPHVRVEPGRDPRSGEWDIRIEIEDCADLSACFILKATGPAAVVLQTPLLLRRVSWDQASGGR
jgi:hypothetical protein